MIRTFLQKRFSLLTIATLLVLGVFAGMKIESARSADDNVIEQIRKFNDVLNNARRNYVDTVNSSQLVEAAIKGMLTKLDPHSIYIEAEQTKRIDEEFRGSFEGIGIEFDKFNDTIVVVTPIAGGPSEQLGIMAGDRIVKINDSTAVKMDRNDVPKKLRGPKGTHVKVSIVHPGSKNIIDYDIVRDKIPLYSVPASFMIDDKTGYIVVNQFTATTHSEMMNALEKLSAQGMKELVLDLRGNPGGYLDQAFKMVDEFLDGGKKIVYTKGRNTEFDEEYKSTSGQAFEKLPLIVLVDNSSASASEIVSGAIQDWDRGLIVGKTTFGKGLVQRQYPLSDGSAYRLTIARYFTPSGRLIQRSYDKGFEEYETEGRARKEEDADNVEHQIDAKKDSARPMFKTAGGRVVYGGGGITPDYIVNYDTVTPYYRLLRSKNAFLEYVRTYMTGGGAELRAQYKDMRSFRDKYVVTDAMLSEFTKFGETKGAPMNQSNYERDKNTIANTIKAYIARDLFSYEGYYYVFHTDKTADDRQLAKALTLFTEARKMVARLK